MNKARRQELKNLKYKKRLKQLKLLTNQRLMNPKDKGWNLTGYKNHGAPCSCMFCSNEKYNRARMKREKIDHDEV